MIGRRASTSPSQNAIRQPGTPFDADVASGSVFVVARSAAYLADYSDPDANLYVWSYTVAFANLSDTPVRLLGRKWRIRDGKNDPIMVLAPSVGGEQPWIGVRDTFTYSSGLPLITPSGIMTGAFGFQTEDGGTFVVEAQPFYVSAPETPPRRSAATTGLSGSDVQELRAHLTRYDMFCRNNHDAELHTGKIKGISEAGRRMVTRFLLKDFPFNAQKQATIPFTSLYKNLRNVRSKDIFVIRKPNCSKLHIVIKWWSDPPNIDFLAGYTITGDSEISPPAGDLNENHASYPEDRDSGALPARPQWKEGADFKAHIEKYYAAELAGGSLHMGVFYRDDMRLWKEAMRLRRKGELPAGLDLITQIEWNDRRVAKAPRRSVGQLLSFLKQIGNTETRDAINLYELGRYRAARDGERTAPKRPQRSHKQLKYLRKNSTP